MRDYENLQKTSENRNALRNYYIPTGISEYHLLNGKWKFAYFERDIDVPKTIDEKKSILLKNLILFDFSSFLCLFATNKRHLSTYPRTPSGNLQILS